MGVHGRQVGGLTRAIGRSVIEIRDNSPRSRSPIVLASRDVCKQYRSLRARSRLLLEPRGSSGGMRFFMAAAQLPSRQTGGGATNTGPGGHVFNIG